VIGTLSFTSFWVLVISYLVTHAAVFGLLKRLCLHEHRCTPYTQAVFRCNQYATTNTNWRTAGKI